MASEPISLRGVILSSREFKDKDRIISFLSSSAGVIDICVKCSGKQSSKFQAATIPFVVCDVVISMTGTFYYLKEFSVVYSNSSILNDLEAMTVASHIGKLLSTSYIDNTNSKDFYELCVYSYYALSESHNSLLIYSAFNWRFLYLLGYCIVYDTCSNCGNELGSAYLSYSSGEAYCEPCFSKIRSYEDRFLMTWAGIKALDHFIEAGVNKLFSINVDEDTLHKLVLFTTRYLNAMIDGEFNSLLDLMKDLNL